MSAKKSCNAATYRKAVVDLCKQQKAQTVVEIGVYTGELSKLRLTVKSVDKLYLIDPWKAYAHYGQGLMDKNYEIVCKMFDGDDRVTILRMFSTAPIVNNIPQVDFVHIDGDHDEPAVRKDIIWWIPKVKDGGILSGDNYEFDGVSAAVDNLLPDRQLAAKGRVWWIRK